MWLNKATKRQLLDRAGWIRGLSTVRKPVTSVTERDEVRNGIISRMAAKLLVVDFEARHRTTQLTAPPVAAQDLLA